MAKSRVSVSRARISVCLECCTPAAASASLLTGAVTIAWISPALASVTAPSMYS